MSLYVVRWHDHPLGAGVTGDGQHSASGAKTPYVAVNRFLGDRPMNFVVADGRRAARTATLHLLRLGYPEVALMVPVSNSSRQLQLEGYRQALDEAGRPRQHDLIFQGTSTFQGRSTPSEHDGYELMQRLLRRPRPPRSKAVQEAGLGIPQDVAIVGDGNLERARSLRPSLTTIDLSYYDLGKAAAEHLLARALRASPSTSARVCPGFADCARVVR